MAFPEVYSVGHEALHKTELNDPDPRGLVLMFEQPRASETYICGVDPTVGIVGWNRNLRTKDDIRTDNGAIEIIRRGKGGKPDVQVCEYAAPIDPEDLATVANILGHLYAGNDDNGCCMQIIEVYPGPGLLTQRKMINTFGYMNMFVWKYLDSMQPKATGSLGWVSSPKSVRDLWIRGTRHISRDQLRILSPFLAEELVHCEADPLKMTAKAASGKHDDRVRAMLMAIWCVPPASLVQRSDGLWVPISSINVGDDVVGKGSEHVQALIVRHKAAPMMSISISGSHRPLVCTKEHKVLVQRYRSGRGNRKDRNFAGAPLEWLAAENLQKGWYVLIPAQFKQPETTIPYDRLWFMGWYLAEGFLSKKNGIVLTLGPHEMNIAVQLQMIAQAWLDEQQPLYQGRKAGKVYIRRTRTSLTINFASPVIAEFLRRHCGTGSHTKRLSPLLCNSSRLLPLVLGWLGGDGCKVQDRATITTVSEQLALQMRQVLLNHGIWCTCHKQHVPARMIEGRQLAAMISYIITIGKPWLRALEGHGLPPIRRQRIAICEQGFMTPITKITVEPYDGLVYDLTTTGHTFASEGVVVHNCAHDWNYQFEDTTVEVVEGKQPNWQSSDCTLDQMYDQWNQRWDELSEGSQ